MHVDLTGKTALVTGASRGIGRAIAEAMIASGARVAVHYRRERVAADEVAAAGTGSIALMADLDDPEQCARLFADAVAALGAIDVLVNNAGTALDSPLDEPIDAWCEKWERTMRVNLLAAGVLSREAIAHFRTRGGGRIVFVASRAAFRGDTPEYLAYAASKGGMVALARSIARGMGKDGVKAFVLAPGFTRTEMADDFIRRYGEEIAMKDVALDRLTEPRDIAPLAVLLASGLADHATGTSIDINAASYVR
ncbi:MAG: SDR family oxidoreductase [Candidatus Krumholzibacteria bacterium]|nr:SDR family oxidoreductase [Candidatus Krumholzibacteria bacterium]